VLHKKELMVKVDTSDGAVGELGDEHETRDEVAKVFVGELVEKGTRDMSRRLRKHLELLNVLLGGAGDDGDVADIVATMLGGATQLR
jgi:hypothetical protein